MSNLTVGFSAETNTFQLPLESYQHPIPKIIDHHSITNLSLQKLLGLHLVNLIILWAVPATELVLRVHILVPAMVPIHSVIIKNDPSILYRLNILRISWYYVTKSIECNINRMGRLEGRRRSAILTPLQTEWVCTIPLLCHRYELGASNFSKKIVFYTFRMHT